MDQISQVLEKEATYDLNRELLKEDLTEENALKHQEVERVCSKWNEPGRRKKFFNGLDVVTRDAEERIFPN